MFNASAGMLLNALELPLVIKDVMNHIFQRDDEGELEFTKHLKNLTKYLGISEGLATKADSLIKSLANKEAGIEGLLEGLPVKKYNNNIRALQKSMQYLSTVIDKRDAYVQDRGKFPVRMLDKGLNIFAMAPAKIMSAGKSYKLVTKAINGILKGKDEITDEELKKLDHITQLVAPANVAENMLEGMVSNGVGQRSVKKAMSIEMAKNFVKLNNNLDGFITYLSNLPIPVVNKMLAGSAAPIVSLFKARVPEDMQEAAQAEAT
jgi:hypothetical protein